MRESYSVTGTLTDSKTVNLDEPLPMIPGRVRVVVEPLTTPPGPSTYRNVMEAIRDRQRLRGHQPPSREDVDASIRAEREAWER